MGIRRRRKRRKKTLVREMLAEQKIAAFKKKEKGLLQILKCNNYDSFHVLFCGRFRHYSLLQHSGCRISGSIHKVSICLFRIQFLDSNKCLQHTAGFQAVRSFKSFNSFVHLIFQLIQLQRRSETQKLRQQSPNQGLYRRTLNFTAGGSLMGS